MRWALTLRRACWRAASAGRYSCRVRPCRCTYAGKAKDLTKATSTAKPSPGAPTSWNSSAATLARSPFSGSKCGNAFGGYTCLRVHQWSTRVSSSTSVAPARKPSAAARALRGATLRMRRVRQGLQLEHAPHPPLLAHRAREDPPWRQATPSVGTAPRPSTATCALPSTRGRTRATSPSNTARALPPGEQICQSE